MFNNNKVFALSHIYTHRVDLRQCELPIFYPLRSIDRAEREAIGIELEEDDGANGLMED